jgi:hypothetical protein
MESIQEKATSTLELIKRDKALAKYIDSSYPIPKPFIGEGPIKLIFLGQDPTVKKTSDRVKIKTVLNLDTNKSVRAYLAGVCLKLGLDIEQNVYATNLFKNFFIHPPTQIKEINIFSEFLPVWLPLLNDELSQYENVPVITLGEPVLQAILNPEMPKKLREYWGYTKEWKLGKFGSKKFIRPSENRLGRTIYPFPHQPSLRKEFYKSQMDKYIAFVKTNAFSA